MEKVLKKKKKKKRTRTFESEFCMGGQTRTDILPYKFLIPVFGFFFFFFFLKSYEFISYLTTGKLRHAP